VNTRPIGIHDVLLIAFRAVTRGLKDQAFSVRGPIGFRVLASVGQLLQIAQLAEARGCG
jgi:hypothetical protein